MEKLDIPPALPLFKNTYDLIEEKGHLLPEAIRNRYISLPDSIREMSEDDIRVKRKFTSIDERLRVNFWKEMQRSFVSNSPMVVARITNGVSSNTHFYATFKEEMRLAWLFCPLIDYEGQLEALLQVATSRYKEILEMDIMDVKKVPTSIDQKTGKPLGYELVKVVNDKRAMVLSAAIRSIEDRVKGTPVNRNITAIENRSKEANIRDVTDMKELDAKLKELESRLDGVGVTATPAMIEEAEFTDA